MDQNNQNTNPSSTPSNMNQPTPSTPSQQATVPVSPPVTELPNTPIQIGSSPVPPGEPPTLQPTATGEQIPASSQSLPPSPSSSPMNDDPSLTVKNPQTNQKSLVMIIGIFALVALLAGGGLYAMGVLNRTKRMGAYKTPGAKPAIVQPTMSEEQELDAINTGSAEADLQDINIDLNEIQ